MSDYFSEWTPPTRLERVMSYFPTIYKEKGKVRVSFANYMRSGALFFWAISLWFIHRRTADEALFFYTYQNVHCKKLKKHRFHFPKSFMIAHCEHNMQCVRFVIEDKRREEEMYPDWPY